MTTGIDTLGLSLDQWADLMTRWGAAPYHGKQIFSWLHQKSATSWEVMTNLAQSLRERLSAEFGSPEPRIVGHLTNEEAHKFAIQWHDDSVVEAVAIRGQRGDTGCISVQVGCRVQCPYCASGKKGFVRDLTAGEIVAQVLVLRRACPGLDHLVFMGMGEPFHNYDNLMHAIGIINTPSGIGIGARRVTISTAGVVPEIYRLANESLQVNLAVSLGAAQEDLRRKLIPMAKVYSFRQLMPALDAYLEKTHRRVSFEYTLLQGVNDRFAHADALAALVRGRLIHVNLIPYNSVENLGFQAPRHQEIKAFRDRLEHLKVPVTIRQSRGSRIQAACGQLAARVQNERTT
ncbi:MAG TPA: 23S rRNA (adenine(2503)-C(2))-methyltransferase RlmN [bacterium]|nr:23S rRNA (adenine(2503)-C(2))-methyltransferase RlmN [bacterium]